MDIEIIEIYLIEYLSKKLNVNVYGQVDDASEDTYVVVEKTGSYVENHTRYATIAIQSYADSLLNSAKLNEKVKTAMEEIIEMPEIAKCSLNSDYNFTDTTTKKYRYQAVFDLVF